MKRDTGTTAQGMVNSRQFMFELMEKRSEYHSAVGVTDPSWCLKTDPKKIWQQSPQSDLSMS
jgi:hypothetical protein